jgi:hypothetical protein
VVEGADLDTLGIDRVGQAHSKYGVKPEYFRVIEFLNEFSQLISN